MLFKLPGNVITMLASYFANSHPGATRMSYRVSRPFAWAEECRCNIARRF